MKTNMKSATIVPSACDSIDQTFVSETVFLKLKSPTVDTCRSFYAEMLERARPMRVARKTAMD